MEGYSVEIFQNGRDAADYLDQQTTMPEILFLDLQMPVMNGWEFLSLAASKPEWNDLPIVVFSATNFDTAKTEPAVACLPKPVEMNDFLEVLEKHRRKVPMDFSVS